jgi:glucose/arabinose dehydrogenase
MPTLKNTTILLATLFLTACSTIPSELPQSTPKEQPQKEIISQEDILTDLSNPWGLTWLPSGEMLITERAGKLWMYDQTTNNKTEILNLPDIFTGGQAGLLDISTNPIKPDDDWIYITYSAGTQNANRTQVARYKLNQLSNPPTLQNEELIFTNNEFKSGTQHFGSRITWLPDGTMLISIGDGGNPPLRFEGQLQREQAQEPTTLFGNIVRINPDGSIPTDNPFLTQENHRPELYTIGHRNIQGLALDPTTNQVWSTEHGSRGGDELNLIKPGENYGWPIVTHSREYTTFQPISEFQTLEGYTDPKLVWSETVAPSGLAALNNTIYAGGLVSKSLHVITTNQNSEFQTEEIININQRVRAVEIGPDQNLWILTDESPNGKLIKITLQ